MNGKKGIVLYSGRRQRNRGRPTYDAVLELTGAMRTVVPLRGKFPDVHKGLLQYTTRVTIYAGKKYIKVQTWLENQGGYGFAEPTESFNFDGLALDLGLKLGDGLQVTAEGKTLAGDVLLAQRNPTGLYKDLAWTLSADGKEAAKGDRTDGVVTVKGANGSVTAAVRHFWQNYEKSIEVTKSGDLRLWLWPRDGEWPRGAKSSSGEFKQFCKPGLYALEGARHKGYNSSSISAAAIRNPPPPPP